MISKTCFMYGEFTDAFLYSNSLFAVKSDGYVECYSLNSILNEIESKINYEDRPFANLFFVRNDWLGAESVKSILRIDPIQKQFLKCVHEFPDRIEISPIPSSEFCPPNIRGEVLDIAMSFNQLYVATDEVCSYSLLNIEESETSVVSGDVFFDQQGIQMSVNTGLLSVSSADSGVFSFTCTEPTEHQLLFSEDEYSIKTSWLKSSLLNYHSLTSVGAHSVTTQLMANSRKQFVSNVEKTAKAINELSFRDHEFDESELRIGTDQVKMIFNSSARLFAQTSNGTVVAGLPEKNDISTLVGMTVVDESFHDDVLSMKGFLGGGFIVESYDNVFWWSEGKRRPLYQGEVLSVRSMPSSKRYKNIVLITHEHGIEITCLLNYPSPNKHR